MSAPSLDGRVAIVTGAGAGLGRAEALALAAAGAHVVLNDLPGAADEAAEEIRALGVEALVVPGDVGERATADAMLEAATEKLGRLDVVVNNAGITRDKMLFNMTDDEFDLVLKVHLRGHFLLSRNAASYWRGRYKETGEPVDAAVVNTASEAFLTGSPGQANYAAAKAGITALTLTTARGLSRVGVRANAICPRARTAMTAEVFGDRRVGPVGRPLLGRARRPARGLPRLARGRERSPARCSWCTAAWWPCSPRPSSSSASTPAATTWDLADLDDQVGGVLRRPRPPGRLRRRLRDVPQAQGELSEPTCRQARHRHRWCARSGGGDRPRLRRRRAPRS